MKMYSNIGIDFQIVQQCFMYSKFYRLLLFSLGLYKYLTIPRYWNTGVFYIFVHRFWWLQEFPTLMPNTDQTCNLENIGMAQTNRYKNRPPPIQHCQGWWVRGTCNVLDRQILPLMYFPLHTRSPRPFCESNIQNPMWVRCEMQVLDSTEVVYIAPPLARCNHPKWVGDGLVVDKVFANIEIHWRWDVASVSLTIPMGVVWCTQETFSRVPILLFRCYPGLLRRYCSGEHPRERKLASSLVPLRWFEEEGDKEVRAWVVEEHLVPLLTKVHESAKCFRRLQEMRYIRGQSWGTQKRWLMMQELKFRSARDGNLIRRFRFRFRFVDRFGVIHTRNKTGG